MVTKTIGPGPTYVLKKPGLVLNAVRVFENACSCSVLCSVFISERVWVPCSGLNVFGVLDLKCCVRVRRACVVFCSVFVCLFEMLPRAKKVRSLAVSQG